MALPLAPGAQVGETWACRLLNAAGTSGNLFGVWFLFQKMCCLLLQRVMMRLGGRSACVMVVASPSWEHVLARSVFGEPVVCGGSSCWAAAGSASGQCRDTAQGHEKLPSSALSVSCWRFERAVCSESGQHTEVGLGVV